MEEKFAHVRSHYAGEVDVAYFVTDPKTHGFKKATATGTAGPMSDEQKEERRTLIANNKAWASAEIVRREWPTTFLSRKTLPKDAAQFVAIALTASWTVVEGGMSNGNRLAATLLGIDAPTRHAARGSELRSTARPTDEPSGTVPLEAPLSFGFTKSHALR
ncbi:hypothetical protein ABCS02_17610 [Microbacterium sp. X-17]|uniref:hypothetical protein n=1 Tax=Microbacterium sp. X-17 TaxID=3144404 RepID=UPI0031F499E8